MSQLKLFNVEPIDKKKRKKFYPLNFGSDFFIKVTDTLLPDHCVVVNTKDPHHFLLLHDQGNNNFAVIRKFR